MFVLTFLLCFIIEISIAQNANDLVPYRKGDEWGFALRDKSIFIVPQHDEVYPFENGFAKVRNGTRYGIINPQGEIIVPIKFDAISAQSEGLFAVRQGVFPASLAGYYDTTGKVQIPFRFVDAFPFYKGKAMVKVGVYPKLKNIFINTKGELDEFYGKSGKYIVRGQPAEGLTSYNYKGKWGYIDENENEIVAPIYEEAASFSEGVAAVKLKNKYGFINSKGKKIIPFQYDMAGNFFKQTAIVYNFKPTNDEWQSEVPEYFLINIKNQKISTQTYDFIGNFNTNDLAVVRKNDKHGLVHVSGKEILPLRYDHIAEFHEGLAVVKLMSKNGTVLSGIIDTAGKEIIPLANIKFTKFSEGLIAFEQAEKVGFMNKNGDITISPKYDQFYWKNYDRSTGTSEFKNGICPVIKNGILIYINTEGIEFYEE